MAAIDADSAIKFAPTLAEAHRVKSIILLQALAFKGSAEELSIASNLAPNDARVEITAVSIEARFGHHDVAVAVARHAIALDPLNPNAYQRLGQAMYWTRHFNEALEAYGHANAVETHPSRRNTGWIALALLAKGDAAAAEHICAGGTGWPDDICLAMAYHALGRQTEAAAKLAKLQQMFGDRAAYQYAQIYAQWGQPAQAMRWLRTAYTLQDSGLNEMKVSPLLDPIRKNTEFAELERRLNFPP
jgi:tetratricopeptide (TPR) repeat protein